MGKFNKTGSRKMPALNTSSLPDLIFTLLFFFMMVTTMREVTLKVDPYGLRAYASRLWSSLDSNQHPPEFFGPVGRRPVHFLFVLLPRISAGRPVPAGLSVQTVMRC